jgi:hypothetical protein
LKEFQEISLAHMLHHIFINYIKFLLLRPNLSVNHANNNLCTWQNAFSMHYIHKLLIHHLSIGGWFKRMELIEVNPTPQGVENRNILLWFKCVLTALHVNCMILFDKVL